MTLSRATYQGMLGLGDNIYQRAWIKAAAREVETVYLSTPWPQLYADIPNVRCMRSRTNLRTQRKNEATTTGWAPDRPAATERRIGYHVHDVKLNSIFEAMGRRFDPLPTPTSLDLPLVLTGDPWPVETDKPIAVLRPPTVRREWTNESRNCLPEYISRIAELLRDTHYVVSLADLQPREEWLIGEPPPADAYWHHGELTTMQVLDLCRRASVLVGSPGWLAPFGIASGVPTLIVLGGQGGQNGPSCLQPPWLGPGRLSYIFPDRFCRCHHNRHRCDKHISTLEAQFREWAQTAL